MSVAVEETRPGVRSLPVPLSISGVSGAGRHLTVAAAALVVAGFVVPKLGSYWTFVATYFLVYSLIGLSLVLITGYAGQISLMAGAVVGVGAFTSAAAEIHWGWPFWASVVASAAVTLPLSLAIGFPALRLRGLYLAIATLAFGKLIEEVAFRDWKWLSGGFGGVQVERPSLGISLDSDARYFWLVLGVFAVVFWFIYGFSRSRIGRATRATRENELAAQAMGVNIVKYKMLAFSLSGVVAGIAGALQIHLVRAAAFDAYSFNLSLSILIMVVIGGAYSLWGGVLGGTFLIIQTELLRGVEWLTRYTDIALGLGVLWVVLSNQEGLAGFFRDQWEWVKEKPRWRAVAAVAFVGSDVVGLWLLVHFGSQRSGG